MAKEQGGEEKLCAIKARIALRWPRMTDQELRESGVGALSGAWVIESLPREGGERGPLQMRCLEPSAQGSWLLCCPLSDVAALLKALEDLEAQGWSFSIASDEAPRGDMRCLMDLGATMALDLRIEAPQSAALLHMPGRGLQEAMGVWEAAAARRGGEAAPSVFLPPEFEEGLALLFGKAGPSSSVKEWPGLRARAERALLERESPGAPARKKPSL